jgi:asparagine synthase (glutamine-hydrolysing)
VEEYFALGYVAEPRTIFKQARKLPPGHSCCAPRPAAAAEPQASTGTCASRSTTPSAPTRRPNWCQRLRESVRLRMIAEVPLGAFLSGGVDSSAVVAMMAGCSPSAGQHLLDRLRRPGLQRVEFAQMVADRYRTNHRVETVKSDDFDLIDTLARLYDEPYADSSAIPTYRVCQLARKHVTVALSGDGGDESFGGYRRYRLHLMEERMRSALPAGLRRPLFGTAGPRLPQGRLGAARVPRQDHLRRHGAHAVEAYFHSGVDPARPDAQPAVQPKLKRELGGYDARGLRPPRGTGRHRRPAGADPVPGHQDLPGGRHQHQGRPRQHGARWRCASR